MKAHNYQYGKLDFEISFWDRQFYHDNMTEAAENAEGAVEIGWAIRPAWTDTLYVFPIINGQIDWQVYPQHAALIPDEVQEVANQLYREFTK
jgi:hypothetical protein